MMENMAMKSPGEGGGSGLPQPFLHSGPSAHPPSCQLRDRAALAGQGAVGPGHKPWPW